MINRGVKKERLPKSPFSPSLAFFLDNPIRRLMTDRDALLKRMGIKGGDIVLELGCGPGFFTETLAILVGSNGRVYAQDVEEAMIARVKEKIERLALNNVITLLCNSSTIELPDNSCDVVFCANVFEEIYREGEFDGTVKEIERVLRKNGRLIVKEHRFGGTKKVIAAVEERFGGPEYVISLKETTTLSYHLGFLKRGGTA